MLAMVRGPELSEEDSSKRPRGLPPRLDMRAMVEGKRGCRTKQGRMFVMFFRRGVSSCWKIARREVVRVWEEVKVKVAYYWKIGFDKLVD